MRAQMANPATSKRTFAELIAQGYEQNNMIDRNRDVRQNTSTGRGATSMRKRKATPAACCVT